MFKSLQLKIVLFFAGLLAVVQAISLGVVDTVTHNNAVQQIEAQLESGQAVFRRFIRYRNKQLGTGITVLASDFAFREAVATDDNATILSVLENHGLRVKADLAMLISLDEMIVADTHNQNLGEPTPFPFPELIAQVRNKRGVSASIIYAGRAYQMLIVPVKAPITIAWVGMGFLIDDALAHELKQLTGLEVSFMDYKEAGQNRIIASTLGPRLIDLLNFVESAPLIFNRPIHIPLGDQTYISYMTQPKQGQRVAMSAILQDSFTQAMKPYDALQSKLMTITALAFVSALLGSIILTRSITKPVRELAEAAKRMEKHGQSSKINIQRQDEIGQLAHAFNHMTQAIAIREEKIIQQAFHDPLTGLPNRLLFTKQINDAIQKTQRDNSHFSLILIRLERYDEVNNTLGHGVGDKLIQQMSTQLQAACAHEIDAFARLSSNQFILLHMEQHSDSLNIAKRVLVALEKGLTLRSIVVDSDVHIGLVLYPKHGKTAQALIQNADVAAHLAQLNGTRIETFDPSHDERNASRLSLMGELRKAIEQNQLELYYQPKVNIKSGLVTHIEALVRWHHPTHGFMPPDSFIPLAEQTGHITRLSRWVIETAIAQMSAFHEEGIDLKICINLSTKDLMDTKLVKLFTQSLEKHNASAQWFVLEVTESSVMQDTSKAIDILTQLNTMGFDLSIDDYGTGYSSMAYIKQLPVQELKIDKSFVLDMPNNQDDETIVQATIELGHRMGLWVIAEGVEDQATLDLLDSMACDMAQGYFICKPITVDRLREWLKTSAWSPYISPILS